MGSPLLDAARRASGHAYAPYSRFTVGCALETTDGRIFPGANVENASYGLTICAERAAVFRAVSEGSRGIRRLAVFAPEEAVPCGACLQVLAEFAEDLDEVEILVGWPGGDRRHRLGELLPHAFRARRPDDPR